MPPPSSFPLLLLLLLLRAEVRSYEAPEDKEDVFARRACPAFLTFNNAVFVSGATVELPCHCKPERVPAHVTSLLIKPIKICDSSAQLRCSTNCDTHF